MKHLARRHSDLSSQRTGLVFVFVVVGVTGGDNGLACRRSRYPRQTR